MSIKEKLKKMVERSKSRKRQPDFDEQGRIICDPKPLVYPVGFKKPPSKEEALSRILKAHQEQMAFNARYEDETNFEINEHDMLSPYERNAHVFEMEPEVPANVSGDQDTPPSQDPTPSPKE